MKELTPCLNCGQATTNPAATICYSCGHNRAPAEAPRADNAPESAITQITKWAPLSPARTRKTADTFVTGYVHPQAYPVHRGRSVVPASRTMLEILLATTMALATLTAIIRPNVDETTSPRFTSNFTASPTKEKWQMVASELTDIGADVRPYSEDCPNLMAVQLRPGVVLSKASALATAQCAHSMLGPFTLVTLRDASGKVIALAGN